jgi:hypothetical protein
MIDSEVVTVTRIAPGYRRTTIKNPPINLFDPPSSRVSLCFRNTSATRLTASKSSSSKAPTPDFLIDHLDFASLQTVPDVPGGQSLMENWPAFSH